MLITVYKLQTSIPELNPPAAYHKFRFTDQIPRPVPFSDFSCGFS